MLLLDRWHPYGLEPALPLEKALAKICCPGECTLGAARKSRIAIVIPLALSQPPAMAQKGWGRVINVASIAAEAPGAGQPAYAASKTGVIGLTRAIAQEFGPKGITANSIMPGLIGAPLVLSMPAHIRDSSIKTQPVKRLGEPADIGNLAAFLAAPSSSFITAQAIACDGGIFRAPTSGMS